MANQHVVPTSKGWGIRKDNGKKITKHYGNKWEAVEQATIFAGNQDSCLTVHKGDGKITSHDCSPSIQTQHVIPDDKGWAVLSPGTEMIEKRFESRRKAVKHAYETAKEHNVCMVLHNKKGDYKSVNCPPNDSFSLFDRVMMRV